MSTATSTPTEAAINNALCAAVEAIQDAQRLLERVTECCMGDDLRRSISDVEDMLSWTKTHPGWTTAEY